MSALDLQSDPRAEPQVSCIRLRGVTVHNLQGIDLDIPRERLTVICGVSGSGKSSLAVNTLFAEGQRRYIESFSAYSRQFLARLPRPSARHIDGIPPAVAIQQHPAASSSSATLGSVTEIIDYLRVFFARLGVGHCPECHRPLIPWTPDRVTCALRDDVPLNSRCLVAFLHEVGESTRVTQIRESLIQLGFVRWVIDDRIARIEETPPARIENYPGPLHVVVDRLTWHPAAESRLREALEVAFDQGRGQAILYIEAGQGAGQPLSNLGTAEFVTLEHQPWNVWRFQTDLLCTICNVRLPHPEPRLFHAGSPWGACAVCQGRGQVPDFDPALAIPDPNKSISEGPVAPWNSPAYRPFHDQLMAFATQADIPAHIPYRLLTREQRQQIQEGSVEHGYLGVLPFFEQLRQQSHDAQRTKFLSQWQRPVVCTACGGSGLRREALAFRVLGKNIHDLSRESVREVLEFLSGYQADSGYAAAVARAALENVCSRLRYLAFVGLDYLSIGRRLDTLSSGELQRVALTTALGSSLVNMLYVLDEPSAGLHPVDVERVVAAIRLLRDRGNTLVVVEHDDRILQAADLVVEIGPGAGEAGGQVTFVGTPQELRTSRTITGEYLSGRRGFSASSRRRQARGEIRLTQATGHNLKALDVSFPMGTLCVVCGVSGSGKSALLEQTLYPALCRRKRKSGPPPLPFKNLTGDGTIDDVILVDQTPIGRTPRSNPVTFVKAFDEIRKVFSETMAARLRNLPPSYFSFNVDGGGRCTTCQGDGTLVVDMQFLADVRMTCPDCQGTRYQREVLDVLYRGKNIAEVLGMTVRQAFAFFRGQVKVQAKLSKLMDLGLSYIRLGQPANTLSAGEAQRLKLAVHLASSKRSRILFVLDEPTRGLHFQDVVQLLDCFDALLNSGHSLIVVEHNLQLLMAADYLIELGPGPAEEGGRLVAQGTPEELAANPMSITGRLLRDRL